MNQVSFSSLDFAAKKKRTKRDVFLAEMAAIVGLSDPGAEEARYDIQSMRAFAGLELGCDAIPDETTIQFTGYQQLAGC